MNKNYVFLIAFFVLLSVPISYLNLLNQFAALLLLSGADYLTALKTQNLALLLMELFDTGYAIAGIFHGLWLLPLGYLVYKSEYFPRIWGLLLVLAGIAIITNSFTLILF